VSWAEAQYQTSGASTVNEFNSFNRGVGRGIARGIA